MVVKYVKEFTFPKSPARPTVQGYAKGGSVKSYAKGGLTRGTKKNAAIHAKSRTVKGPSAGALTALAGALGGQGMPMQGPQAPPGMAPGMGAPPGAPMGPAAPPGMPMAMGGSVRHVIVHHISKAK